MQKKLKSAPKLGCDTNISEIHQEISTATILLAQSIDLHKMLYINQCSEKHKLVSAYYLGDSNFVTGNIEWCADDSIEVTDSVLQLSLIFFWLYEFSDHEASTAWQHARALLQSKHSSLHGESSDTPFMLPRVTIIHIEEYTNPSSSMIEVIYKRVCGYRLLVFWSSNSIT